MLKKTLVVGFFIITIITNLMGMGTARLAYDLCQKLLFAFLAQKWSRIFHKNRNDKKSIMFAVLIWL